MVSCLTQVLGAELGSPAKVTTFITGKPSFQSLGDLYNSSIGILLTPFHSHTLLEGARKMCPFSWVACWGQPIARADGGLEAEGGLLSTTRELVRTGLGKELGSRGRRVDRGRTLAGGHMPVEQV